MYIYNIGRYVYVEYGNIILSYQGPKNIVSLKELVCLSPEMVAHIITYYKNDDAVEAEEEFYDLKELFEESGYELPSLSVDEVYIGKPENK